MDQPQQPQSIDDLTANTTPTEPTPNSTVPAVPPASTQGEQQAHQPDGDKVDELTERAREAADRLKPVAIAVEEIAGQAVNLSIKGLNQLSAYLQRRHEERETEHHTSEPPKTEE